MDCCEGMLHLAALVCLGAAGGLKEGPAERQIKPQCPQCRDAHHCHPQAGKIIIDDTQPLGWGFCVVRRPIFAYQVILCREGESGSEQ